MENIKINHCYEDLYIARKNFPDKSGTPVWIPVAQITLLPEPEVKFTKKLPLLEEEKAYIKGRVDILVSALKQRQNR